MRRTWDRDAYEKRAQDRQRFGDDFVDGEPEGGRAAQPKSTTREEFRAAEPNAEGPMGSERAFLKSREGKVELEEKAGKIEVINPTDPNGAKAGYWCEVCKCLLKDSASYLDHINGKKHQRMLGFSMRVERADVTNVKDRLAELKRKLHTSAEPRISAIEEYKQRQAAQEAELEDFKRRRKEDQAAKKAQAQAVVKQPRGVTEDEADDDAHEVVDDEMAAMLGFKGFGTSKR